MQYEPAFLTDNQRALQQTMLQAIRNQDYGSLHKQLADGYDVNSPIQERLEENIADGLTYVSQWTGAPLHFAVLAGNEDLVRLFLRHGADLGLEMLHESWVFDKSYGEKSQYKSERKLASGLALQIERQDLMLLLNEHRKLQTELKKAYSANDVAALKRLIQKGLSPDIMLNWRENDGDVYPIITKRFKGTALHHAILHGKLEMLMALIESGASLKRLCEATTWLSRSPDMPAEQKDAEELGVLELAKLAGNHELQQFLQHQQA